MRILSNYLNKCPNSSLRSTVPTTACYLAWSPPPHRLFLPRPRPKLHLPRLPPPLRFPLNSTKVQNLRLRLSPLHQPHPLPTLLPRLHCPRQPTWLQWRVQALALPLPPPFQRPPLLLPHTSRLQPHQKSQPLQLLHPLHRPVHPAASAPPAALALAILPTTQLAWEPVGRLVTVTLRT